MTLSKNSSLTIHKMISTRQRNRRKSKENTIKLKVVGQGSKAIRSRLREVHFNYKMSKKMGRLKKFYETHIGVPIASLQFLFAGKRIKNNDTPKTLKMRQNDVIEVRFNCNYCSVNLFKVNDTNYFF